MPQARLARQVPQEPQEQQAPPARLARQERQEQQARQAPPARQVQQEPREPLLRQYMHNTEIAVTMRLSTILKTIKQPL